LAAQLHRFEPPVITCGPDEEVIRLCDEHIANWRACSSYEGDLEPGDNLLWLAYLRTLDAVTAAVPKTLDGIVAKARAAKAEAWRPEERSEDPSVGMTPRWAWDIVNALVQLHGGDTNLR